MGPPGCHAPIDRSSRRPCGQVGSGPAKGRNDHESVFRCANLGESLHSGGFCEYRTYTRLYRDVLVGSLKDDGKSGRKIALSDDILWLGMVGTI